MAGSKAETYLYSELADVLVRPFPDASDFEAQAQRQLDIASTVGSVGLCQVQPGYEMYAKVTKLVHSQLDRFTFQEKIIETIPKFSQSAEDHLVFHTLGMPQLVGRLWVPLYYGKRKPDSPFDDVSDFWKAHIVEDLPPTYARTNTQPKHRLDADKVNIMLEAAAWQIMRENFGLPDFIGRIGVSLAMRDIEPMRDRAFDDGQALLAANGNERIVREIMNAPRKAGITEHPVSRRVLGMIVAAIADFRGKAVYQSSSSAA